MNKILPLVLAILILAPVIAYASDFTISVQEQEEYLAGKVYTLPVTITNSGPEERFSISLLGVQPDWASTSTISLKVGQSSSGIMDITFAPPKDAKPGFYNYLLNIETSTGEIQQKQLLMWVRQISSVIVTDLELSCTNCVEMIDVSGNVDNVGTRDQVIKLSVFLAGEEKVHEFGVMNSSAIKSFEDSFSLAESQPGDYVVTVELRNETNHLIFSDERTFSIKSLKNMTYDKSTKSNIFGTFVAMKATNNGNGNNTAIFEGEVSNKWYEFYNGPKPNSISGNVYSWSIELEQGKYVEVNYSKVYWPVIFVTIVLVVVGLYMYVRLVTLSIRKRVKSQKVEKDKEIAVSLHINSKMRTAESVFVKDHVPLGFSIPERFETLKPLIRKKDNGIELVWKVGTIGKNEERLINYKIKPTKEVTGKVKLPPAVIRAKYNGRPAEERSNPVFVYGKDEQKKTVSVKVE